MFYLFHGTDEFSAHEELRRLRVTGGFDLNQDTHTGDEIDLAQIRAACDTLPFLSERRLVVVLIPIPKRKRGAKGDEDSDENSSVAPGPTPPASKTRGKKGKSSGPDLKALYQGLADYAPHLPETTTLVVLAEEQLDATNPLINAAKKYGKMQVFTRPKGAQLDAWLRARAKDRQTEITPEACRLLVESVGDNTRLLASEIDKLSAYVGVGGKIGVAEVRLLTPIERQLVIFDLTDAIARRDRSRALALLHEFLDNGQSQFGIIGLIASQTRALMQVKTLAEMGMHSGQIAQTAGMAPFVVEKNLTLSRQFTFAQLEAAHRALLEIDTALKRSRMTSDMALDLFVVSFGRTEPI
ncbi:MAG: DNA polymerase III subunit delta [Ktedonobacterales bacterium]